MLYVPTNEAEERIKDEFYKHLQREVKKEHLAWRADYYGGRELQSGLRQPRVRESDGKAWNRIKEGWQWREAAESCALNDLAIGGTLFRVASHPKCDHLGRKYFTIAR